MIERQYRQNIIVCDRCSESYEPYDSDQFGTMIAAAKGDGWDIRPDGEGHYTHACPDCYGARQNRAAEARRMFGL